MDTPGVSAAEALGTLAPCKKEARNRRPVWTGIERNTKLLGRVLYQSWIRVIFLLFPFRRDSIAAVPQQQRALRESHERVQIICQTTYYQLNGSILDSSQFFRKPLI